MVLPISNVGECVRVLISVKFLEAHVHVVMKQSHTCTYSTVVSRAYAIIHVHMLARSQDYSPFV